MPNSPAAKKLRVYEVAKELGMSSEAVLQVARKMGAELKNHMSTLTPDVVDKVRSELRQTKAEVKEDIVRKDAEAAQRARDDRARQEAAAAARANAPVRPGQGSAVVMPAAHTLPGAPPPRPAPPPGPTARPGGPSSGGRPAGGYAGRPQGSAYAGRPSGGGYAGRPSSGSAAAAGPATGGSRFGAPGAPSAGAGRGNRRDRKKKKFVDEKQAAESVRKTLASLDVGQGRRRHRRRDEEGGDVAAEETRLLKAPEFITVAELANMMQVKPQEVIAACMRLGLMATINKRLDKDSMMAVADEFGYEVEIVTEFIEEAEAEVEEVVDETKLRPRAPVVTVMGHVDHGKTSLLDYVRRTNVVAGESGGITQHIGAYEVTLPAGQHITFLDTPGHEAFTAMRARGAQVTDLVVLVVAADDQVRPQTIEAIDHAKAANVPIIVAINKIDLPTADTRRIKTQLTEHGVVVEEFGGKYVCVEISAKKGQNIDKLLDLILITSELLELKADPMRRGKGVVLEARVEQGRGVVASVLIQSGTLRIGDPFVAGQSFGRVRAMYDERRRQIREAPPSTPAEVVGLEHDPRRG